MIYTIADYLDKGIEDDQETIRVDSNGGLLLHSFDDDHREPSAGC